MNLTVTTKRFRPDRAHIAFFGFVLLLALITSPRFANADAGIVRAKATQSDFMLTIFTPVEIALGLPTEINVLVQKRDSGEMVMDAAVDLGFVSPAGTNFSPRELFCGPAGAIGSAVSIRATRDRANKFLYGATVQFPMTGDWQLRIVVRQNANEAAVSCILPVEAPRNRLRSIWPLLALPPLAVSLFALNQRLRRRPVSPHPA